MMRSLTISSKERLEELEHFKSQNAGSVSLAERKGFGGSEAEFIAVVTLAGVTIKSLLDIVLAIITRGKNIEISYGGKTIKGVTYKKAKEILEEIERDISNDTKE